jgi:hypothetical protein
LYVGYVTRPEPAGDGDVSSFQSRQAVCVCEVKRTLLSDKDQAKRPWMRLRLIVVGNVLGPQGLHFFVSNAPAETSAARWLLVDFSPWHVKC